MSSENEIPAVKADKNGNYYFWFSPRGFANEGNIYFTPAQHVGQVEAFDNRAREVNGGRAKWMDAKDAIEQAKGSPLNITDHPWFDYGTEAE